MYFTLGAKDFMKILGFGHRKRVGKDTATNFAIGFARQYRPDLNIQVLSFGNIIKFYCYHMYSWGGLEEADYYENHPSEIEVVLPSIGKSPRQIWDHVGLMARSLCDRTWVELALKGVDADILICKDVRGRTEFELIQQCGGLSVRIIRPDMPLGSAVDDILESASWDRVILNKGSLGDFCTQVKLLTRECIDTWFPIGVK